jgi:hypothetical protein
VKTLKIKKRKVELYRISVPIINRTYRDIYVTKKQLDKLTALHVGREIFLSRFYCLIGGDFHALRTNNGLQYMPNPHRNVEKDDGLGAFYEV